MTYIVCVSLYTFRALYAVGGLTVDSFTKQRCWTTGFTLHHIYTDMFFWFNWGLEFYSESRLSKCMNDRINGTFSALPFFLVKGL